MFISCMKLSHPTHTINDSHACLLLPAAVKKYGELQRNISHVILIIQRGSLERQKLSLDYLTTNYSTINRCIIVYVVIEFI